VIASHADQQQDSRHADASRQSQQDSIAANRGLCGLPWLHQETGRSHVQESDHALASASDIFEPARDKAHTVSATEWPVVGSGAEAGGAGQAQLTPPTGHDILAVAEPSVVLQSESPSAALTAVPVMAHLIEVPADQAAVSGCLGRSKSAAAGQNGTKFALKAVARHSKTSSKVGKQLGSRKVDLPSSQAARDTSRLQHVMALAPANHVEVPKELGVTHSDTPVRREARAAASSSDTHVMPSQMHDTSPRPDAVPTSMHDGRNLQAAAVSPRAAAASPRASPKAAVPRAAGATPRASLTARASPKAAAKSKPAFVSATRSGCIVLPSRHALHRPHCGRTLASTPSATEAVKTSLADHMPSNEHQVLAVQVDNQALVSQLDTHPVSLMHISHDASSAGKIEMAEPQQDQQSYSSAHHCPQTYADCSHKGSEISQAAADHLHGADDHRHMATDHRHMAVDHCHEATDHRHMAVHHYHVGADHHKSDASGQLGGADQQQLGHPLLLDSSRPVQASASDDMAHDSQSDCESSSRSADSDLDYGQSLSSQLESASGDKRRQISSARDDFARQPDSVGSIAQLFMMRQRAKLVFQVSVLILV